MITVYKNIQYTSIYTN